MKSLARHTRSKWSGDRALAAAFLTAAALEAAAYGLPATSLVSVTACALALSVRRRAPLVAAVAVALAPFVDRALGGPWVEPLVPLAAVVLAAYSTAAYLPRWQALAGGLIVLGGVWAQLYLVALAGSFELGFFGILVGLPWAAGRAARGNRRRAQLLAELTARLKRERDTRERLAVAEEKARLAGELRDAIADCVNQMLVEAAAARLALARQPARAAEALRRVQHTGREAITELTRMLQILRAVDNESSSAPVPEAPAIKEPRRLVRWTPRLDAVLALSTLAATVAELVVTDRYTATQQLTMLLLAPALTLPLIARTRHPLGALAVLVVVATVGHAVLADRVHAPVGLQFTLLLVGYSVGAHTPIRTALLALVATDLALWTSEAVASGTLALPYLLETAFYSAVPLFSGAAVRVYRRQANELHLVASRLQRELAARARLAVLEERSRMARELHDTVAHGVSVMVLQAGAGEQALATDVARCEGTVTAIEDVGRETLSELARILRLLHLDLDIETAAGPSLARIEALVKQTRDAGRRVALHVEGEPAALPVAVEISAYRIVQESLTNALKHAGDGAIAVTVRYTPDSVGLEILNAAASPPASTAVLSAGHGLVGMRERAALHGGLIHAGPDSTGGFRVHADLPIKRSAAMSGA